MKAIELYMSLNSCGAIGTFKFVARIPVYDQLNKSNITEQYFPVLLFIHALHTCKMALTFELSVYELESVTIQMNLLTCTFLWCCLLLTSLLHTVVLTFESVDEIHSVHGLNQMKASQLY